METKHTYEITQPWVVYHYGRTHDLWWPLWNSTRVIGRACVVCECAVCGDVTSLWFKMPRIGRIISGDPHPKRTAYLEAHAHPDRGAPMSWAKPLLNLAAHGSRIDLEALAMRLEADLNQMGNDA